MSLLPDQWYAVAALDDLPMGHVYQTRLDGAGLAIWRASDGAVQVWEDRCPHRGVRFSLGEVVGDELRCQYHAWRFGKGGACTFIPAQPEARVPSTLRARVWPVAEADGLVWTGIAPEGTPPALGGGEVLRAMPVNRSAEEVAQAAGGLDGVALVVQPLEEGRAVIRGVSAGLPLAAADAALEALRRRLEAPC